MKQKEIELEEKKLKLRERKLELEEDRMINQIILERDKKIKVSPGTMILGRMLFGRFSNNN